MPAVIVGRHAEQGVGDFGFAEKFALGGRGHVNDVGGEGGAVEAGFGASGELGAFCWRRGVSERFLVGTSWGWWGVRRERGRERGVPMQTIVPFSCSLTPSPSSTPGLLTAFATSAESGLSKGSAKGIWPTTPPSKNVHGRTYFSSHSAMCSQGLSL